MNIIPQELDDAALEAWETWNRLWFGDPYAVNPQWLPLWVGPGPCPTQLRRRTAFEIRNNIR